MSGCRRCDFQTDDLSEHAAESGHYLCIVCQRRSLTEHERQTCATCVARVRADLADIVQGYAELEPTGVQNLTLLGDGTMQRLFRQDEADSYLASAHPLARDGERTPKPIRDELLSDPLPVLPTLVSWEDFIREDCGAPKGEPDPTLTQVVDWLTTNLDARREIAQTFPAFDEFASDVRRLRSAVQHAAGLADDPVEAPARCFDCGEPLVRTYGPKGLTDDWTCSGCRGVYDQQSYFLALKAHVTEASPDQWRPIAVAAWLVDRPFRTVQTWVRELAVRSACSLDRKRQVVWMPDVKELSDATGRRDRKAS